MAAELMLHVLQVLLIVEIFVRKRQIISAVEACM